MAKDEGISAGVSTRSGAHVPDAKYERLIARAKNLPPVRPPLLRDVAALAQRRQRKAATPATVG